MTRYKNRDIIPPSGKSMVSFLDGEAQTVYGPDDWTAFELFGNAYIVRGDYKAMKVRAGMWRDGKWHLYHLRNDPAESTPLEGSMPEELADLVAIYEGYADQWQIKDVGG